MEWLNKIKDYLHRNEQHTFVYCPKCHNEMVSNGFCISDHDGIVKYRCSLCNNVSFWDFTLPVPFLRTCAVCRHLLYGNDGSTFCSKNCFPDTQNLFEAKGKK